MKKFFHYGMVAMAGFAVSGCATHELLDNHTPATLTKTVKQTLVEDRVLAFGKPATLLPETNHESIVIIGEKNSYVLTQGSQRFATLINYLDPDYIKLTKSLDFYSANNDGRFNGTLGLKYSQLKENISKKDREFFLKNNADECTSYDENKMDVQSFCFDVNLSGVVYPAVAVPSNMKRLSKYYPVSIYTETKTTVANPDAGRDTGRKLVLLPFAVAFDVVTLPLQALYEIFD